MVFKKKDFEELLGVSELKTKDVEEYTDRLMQPVTITDSKYKEGFTIINIFEKCGLFMDESTGDIMIELSCSQLAVDYFFNVEALGYIKYRLEQKRI